MIMPSIELRFFGSPQIARDGKLRAVQRRKSLALLAYLAVTGQAHARDTLATLFWPELDAEHGRAALRSVLVDLHHTLGHEWLVTEGDQIRLTDGPELLVDVARFLALTVAVTVHHPAAQPLCDVCLTRLVAAAALYRADFLAGFTLADTAEFDTWQTLQTETLRLRLADILERLATALAERGQWEAALDQARRWLALDSLHEPAHRMLMQLYAQSGDRAAAARQYRECAKTLHEELGAEPELETTALYRSLSASPPSTLSHMYSPTATLPPDLTPFIGRQGELSLLAERLADPACRLLTVLGPGGIGKTRLAIQAARHAQETFRQGACFVDLAPLTSAELISTAILHEIPGQRAAIEPDQYLLSYLADKQMLLVLDNYEHLLSGPENDRRDGYGLVTKLVAAAPEVKLLITSRARLNVAPEWLAPLEGLETPAGELPEWGILNAAHRFSRAEAKDAEPLSPAAASPDAALPTTQGAAQDAHIQELTHYSATALFLACARRIRPDFRPTVEDARRVARISRLLGGVPLAIELAAAWLRTLPLTEIEAELARGLDILQSTARDAIPRHRSMTAAFDHSWRLLSGRQRSILRQLAIFRGGFTREAAQAVAGASAVDLAGLADASWLRLGSADRHDLHELVRQYCAHKLATEHTRETGMTLDAVRDQHCTYFAGVADTYGGWFRAMVHSDPHALIPEFPNLEIALLRAIERRNLDLVRQLQPLFGFSIELGRYRALLQILDPTIGKVTREWEAEIVQAPDRAPTTATLLAFLYWIRAWQYLPLGRSTETMVATNQGLVFLEQAKRCELWEGTYIWLHLLHAAAISSLEDPASALQELREVCAHLEQPDAGRWSPQPEVTVTRWRGLMALNCAHVLMRMGRPDEALRSYEQALAHFEASGGAPLGIALCRMALGRRSFARGQYDEARRQQQAALDLYQASRSQIGIGEALGNLAEIAAATGEITRARHLFRRSIAISRAMERHGLVCSGFTGLGRLELELGRPTRAAEYYQAALAHGQRAAITPDYMPPALIGLGRAALALGDRSGAHDYLRRALRCPSNWAHHRLEAIATVAQVCAAEGDLLRAVELLAFAIAHPAMSQRVRRPFAQLLAEFEAELTAESFAAAAARGHARELGEIVAELTVPQSTS
jgi:predicted ATPase/DNA-binding SARP family transcriptional activator